MKLLILTLCICFHPALAHAQATSSSHKTGAAFPNQDRQARLQLTTSIVERKHHCSNFMGLKVRLTFKNIGKEPIILDKRSFIVGTMVSRDLKAAAAKQYETTTQYDLFDGAFFNVDPSDMSNFIILKPGEVYEKTRGVGSFWVTAATPLPLGYLNPGTHFLQLQVNTWSYFADSKPFKMKWRDKGVLWLELMSSQPMPFTIQLGEKPLC